MLSDWWNGVELWISGLPFPFQFALVIAVLAPVCLVVAWLIDRIVDNTSTWFGPSETDELPLGSTRHDAEADDPSKGTDTETGTHETGTGEPGEVDEPALDADRVPAESTGR